MGYSSRLLKYEISAALTSDPSGLFSCNACTGGSIFTSCSHVKLSPCSSQMLCSIQLVRVISLLSSRLQLFLFRRHLHRPFSLPNAISTTDRALLSRQLYVCCSLPVKIVAGIYLWCNYGNVASIDCTNALWYSPTIMEEGGHFSQLRSSRILYVHRKQHLDGCFAEVFNAIMHRTQAYPKKLADGSVITAGGQLPDGNCHSFSKWDAHTVVCVPSPNCMPELTADVFKRLMGHTEMLHESLCIQIRNNCVPPVLRLWVCPGNRRPPMRRQQDLKI